MTVLLNLRCLRLLWPCSCSHTQYSYLSINTATIEQYNCHHFYHNVKSFYANCWLLYCFWTMCSCHTASYSATLVGTVFAIVLPCALVVFRRISKIAKSVYELRHVCPSARLSARNNSASTGRIFMKFDIWVFVGNLSWIFEFH